MSEIIIAADGRGKFHLELYRNEDHDASILLGLTPPPQTQYFSLDAAEARRLAAVLMDYADQLDLIEGAS